MNEFTDALNQLPGEAPEDLALATPTLILHGEFSGDPQVTPGVSLPVPEHIYTDRIALLEAELAKTKDTLAGVLGELEEAQQGNRRLMAKANPTEYSDITYAITSNIDNLIALRLKDFFESQALKDAVQIEIEHAIESREFCNTIESMIDGKIEDIDPSDHYNFTRAVEGVIDDYDLDLESRIRDALDGMDVSITIRT